MVPLKRLCDSVAVVPVSWAMLAEQHEKVEERLTVAYGKHPSDAVKAAVVDPYASITLEADSVASPDVLRVDVLQEEVS